MAEVRIPHTKQILKEQKIPESKVLPGMVLTFQYSGTGVYDRRPLIFVIYNNKEKKLIEGVNLNYLKEFDVQHFFKECDRIGAPTEYENLLGLKEDYIRVKMKSFREANPVDGKYLYKNIFHRNKRFMKAYRSYKFESATSMKVVNYNVDILKESEDSAD